MSVFVIQSFNFIDFQDIEQPFKRDLIVGMPSDLSRKFKLDVDLDLTLASFQDNLINPFEEDDGKFEFLSAKSKNPTTSLKLEVDIDF